MVIFVQVVSTCETIPASESLTGHSGQPSMADRIADQKTIITAFAAEHTLPYSICPDLLAMGKRLAEDKKALLKTTMGRTSATYISTHGLAAGFKEELNIKLRSCSFSLNIDEATDNAMDKIVLHRPGFSATVCEAGACA